MYSRIERGDRQAKKEQVILLSDILHIDRDELLCLWIADKINAVIEEDPKIANKALKMIIDKNDSYAHQWRQPESFFNSG